MQQSHDSLKLACSCCLEANRTRQARMQTQKLTSYSCSLHPLCGPLHNLGSSHNSDSEAVRTSPRRETSRYDCVRVRYPIRTRNLMLLRNNGNSSFSIVYHIVYHIVGIFDLHTHHTLSVFTNPQSWAGRVGLTKAGLLLLP